MLQNNINIREYQCHCWSQSRLGQDRKKKKVCNVWYEEPVKKTLAEGKNSKQNGVCKKKNDWIKRVMLFLSNTEVKLSLFFFTVEINRCTLDRTTI